MRNKRSGFSLVELVVVVLILGILAAVAAPRMFDTANDARMNGTKQSLSVIRDAIELYKSQNGSFPPAATMSTALKPFIKGSVPRPSRSARTKTRTSSPRRKTRSPPSKPGTAGWAYNQTTGELVVNNATYLTW